MSIDLLPTPSPNPCPEIQSLVDEILAVAEDRLLEQDVAHWQADLQKRLEQFKQHPEQGLGFLEEHIRQASLQLQRLLLQKTMQEKANTVEEKCPECGAKLTDKKRRVVRTHGWCPHCGRWHFPADRVLGLREDSTASPLVQEMCALLVSKMPAQQAEAICLRVTGRRLGRSTLARQAQRQGDHAIAVRRHLLEAPSWMAPAAQLTLGQDQPAQPFTLVIQIDAWNVRERDHWGQFWSTRGDEALLALEMFWRNERWEMLFPHAKLTAAANN